MDPAVAVYATTNNNQRIKAAFGRIATAVELAGEGGYPLVVVSSEEEPRLHDWIALGDLDRLIRPQILMAADMDELVAAARIDRAAEVQEAIDLFSEVEELTNKMTLEEAAKNEVVQQRLEAIVDQFPQHLSAKMLLAYGKGGEGLTASLSGSFRSIRETIEPLALRYNNAMSEDGEDGEDGIDVLELGDKAGERLKDLDSKVNEETREFLVLSEKLLGALVSYLRVSNKGSSSAQRRRGDVEENFREWQQERRRLEDVMREQRRKQREGGNGQ